MKLRKERKRARVEMLPLMDVIFLLLVFFIYSMVYMVVQRGLPVNLPASKVAVVQNRAVMAITIQPDGTIALDKEPLALEVLTETLKQRSQQIDPNAMPGEPGSQPAGTPGIALPGDTATDGTVVEKIDPAVQIMADENVTYGQLYQVLDAVKLSGIRKISLQAKQS